jgi:hypothetical protein
VRHAQGSSQENSVKTTVAEPLARAAAAMLADCKFNFLTRFLNNPAFSDFRWLASAAGAGLPCRENGRVPE